MFCLEFTAVLWHQLTQVRRVSSCKLSIKQRLLYCNWIFLCAPAPSESWLLTLSFIFSFEWTLQYKPIPMLRLLISVYLNVFPTLSSEVWSFTELCYVVHYFPMLLLLSMTPDKLWSSNSIIISLTTLVPFC